MSKSATRRSSKRRNGKPVMLERDVQRRVLRAQLKIERDVQRLTRQLQREIERTNDRIQELAAVLGSRARAIEAEHEAELAMRG